MQLYTFIWEGLSNSSFIIWSDRRGNARAFGQITLSFHLRKIDAAIRIMVKMDAMDIMIVMVIMAMIIMVFMVIRVVVDIVVIDRTQRTNRTDRTDKTDI